MGTRLFGLADSVWPFRSGRFGLAVSVRPFRSGRFGLADVIWPIRSEPFRSGPFRSGPFRSGPFRSGDISVRLWNLAEILHVHIFYTNILKSTRSFI